MTPCFRQDILERILPTMQLSRAGTGFGLDLLWPAMLYYQDIWIVDRTPVHHTRPVGAVRDAALAALSMYDLRFIQDLGIPWHSTAVGGLLHDGRFLNADHPSFASLDFEGHAYLLDEGDRDRFRAQNRERPPRPRLDPTAFIRLGAALEHLNRTADNLSRGKPALVSSSSEWSWTQDRALLASGGNDGRINGACGFHTALETNPWWQVDFQEIATIRRVEIYNRLDQKHRFVDFNILASPDGRSWRCVHAKQDGRPFGGADGTPWQMAFPDPFAARFLRVEAIGETYLHLDQVNVYGQYDIPGN